MAGSDRELRWLRRARDLAHRLAVETNLERLPPAILDAAIELTEAERGFMVRVRGRRPQGGFDIRVEAARGFDRTSIQSDPKSVSRSVLRRVLDEDRGLVTTSEEDRDLVEVSSVQARRVLSILCVPMRLRGETRGVLYLDHRFSEGAFQEDDLSILETFADQAALALETADLRGRFDQATEQLGATHRELEALRVAAASTGAQAVAQEPAEAQGLGKLIGNAPAMLELYEAIERAARSWDPVLVLGESGAGKGLVARELHARGSHPEAPFLVQSCASVADALLESELFGHERGAFTGASSRRRGLILRAGEGTLLLDEVGDMSPDMQAKLLQVLQERRIRPVGSDTFQPVSCRIVAATHADLRALVGEGGFREDLYYRLDVLRIVVPPLRERPGDIPLLIDHFAREVCGHALELTDHALDLLVRYTWPGNVRELRSHVRRLAGLGESPINARHLAPEVREGRGVSRAPAGLSGKTLPEVEREMVRAALESCDGNKSRAARQLGIPRSTLYNLIERYGL